MHHREEPARTTTPSKLAKHGSANHSAHTCGIERQLSRKLPIHRHNLVAGLDASFVRRAARRRRHNYQSAAAVKADLHTHTSERARGGIPVPRVSVSPQPPNSGLRLVECLPYRSGSGAVQVAPLIPYTLAHIKQHPSKPT